MQKLHEQVAAIIEDNTNGSVSFEVRSGAKEEVRHRHHGAVSVHYRLDGSPMTILIDADGDVYDGHADCRGFEAVFYGDGDLAAGLEFLDGYLETINIEAASLSA